MKKQAILARTTTDIIKSKILGPQVSQLVFEVYMTPSEFGELITKYLDREFILEIKDEK